MITTSPLLRTTYSKPDGIPDVTAPSKHLVAQASGVDRVQYVVIDGTVFELANGANWDGVIAAVEAAKAARGL